MIHKDKDVTMSIGMGVSDHSDHPAFLIFKHFVEFVERVDPFISILYHGASAVFFVYYMLTILGVIEEFLPRRGIGMASLVRRLMAMKGSQNGSKKGSKKGSHKPKLQISVSHGSPDVHESTRILKAIDDGGYLWG